MPPARAFRGQARSSEALVHHPVEVPAVGDALQLVPTGVLEREPRARDEVFHGLRDEHFGRAG